MKNGIPETTGWELLFKSYHIEIVLDEIFLNLTKEFMTLERTVPLDPSSV